MNDLSIIRNRKGFVGLALITISMLTIIIASMVLLNSFCVFFKIGVSAESASADYEYLSSGIYYGIWLVGKTGQPGHITINGIQVPVTVSPPIDGTYTITAGPSAALHNRKITCEYNGSIVSWN